MSVTNLTGTKWLFNRDITVSGNFEFSINFEALLVNVYTMYDSLSIYTDKSAFYGDTRVRYADSTSWNGEGYRIIQIYDGDDVENSDLIDFLENNAAFVGTAPISMEYDGSTISSAFNSSAKALKTANKSCNSDIIVRYNTQSPVATSYELRGVTEVSVNTTSTTPTKVATVYIQPIDWDANKIVYVRVRDKAGPRSGYFYGSDCFFINDKAAIGSTTTLQHSAIQSWRYTGTQYKYSTSYGVYGYEIYKGVGGTYVSIYRQYSSSTSGTINGTYLIEVYLLNYIPGKTLFPSS